MRQVHLRAVDLNLLVVLQALLDARSVTRAAQQLNMSQPAVSRALGRLRALFKDTLLVSVAGGYALTTRAEEIKARLTGTLTNLADLLNASEFDPAAATGTIRLLMPDLHASALAPGLLSILSKEAPGLDLDIIAPTANVTRTLENDEAEAAVGVFDDAGANIVRRKLYDDHYVTLMRTDHPAATRKLTLKRYLELSHMVVSVTGQGPAPLDETLAAMGHTRNVKVRVPSFFAAAEIAARSDVVMTLPASLARTAIATGRLLAVRSPLDSGPISVSLFWHARHQDSPRHVWIRQTLVRAAAELNVKQRRE